MDWILYLKAVILGIVEGLTEFLPVSSTGHLIVAGSLLDYTGQEADTFYIAIQAGAIFAVCWHYRQRLIDICLGLFSDKVQQRLAINTIVAFLPAAVIGVLVASYIKKWLFNPIAVATALVVGGVIILIVEYFQDKKTYKPRVETMDDMSWKDALRVGFLQCLAMIPAPAVPAHPSSAVFALACPERQRRNFLSSWQSRRFSALQFMTFGSPETY